MLEQCALNKIRHWVNRSFETSCLFLSHLIPPQACGGPTGETTCSAFKERH